MSIVVCGNCGKIHQGEFETCEACSTKPLLPHLHREDRTCELKDLLSTLDLLCTTYDLRLGQALVLAITDKQIDLFNIENGALEILVKKKLEA